MMWIRRHSAEILVTTLVLAAGAGVYWYAHRDVGQLEESKERGAVLVAALERYHAEEGTYPETLEALVPAYLPAVEPPSWGLQRWRYRRYTPAEVTGAAVGSTSTVPVDDDGEAIYFQLSVAANQGGYPVLFYDFTARRWVLNN